MRTFTVCGLFATLLLHAPTQATDTQTAPAPSACVDVEVSGYRALSFDCLSQQMAPPKDPRPGNPARASEDIAKQAPNRLGLFNQAATSNRMGNQFGKSAFPQRPPAVPNVSPLLNGK